MSQQDKSSMNESGKSKTVSENKNSARHQNVESDKKPEAAEADTQSEFAKAEELRNRE